MWKMILKIACIEEIAYRNGLINKDQLLKLSEPLKKNDYGKYLLKIVKLFSKFEA